MRKALWVALGLAAILCLDVWVHTAAAGKLLVHAHVHALHPLEHPFWDAEPYVAAITDYQAGRSPYHTDDLTNPLPFAYPPAFVWAGAALAKLLPPPWGWHTYLVLNLASLFGLQMLFGAIFLRKPRGKEWLTAACLLPLAALLSTAFLSGNIHAIWYFAVLLAAVPGVRHNRWITYYLITLLATINQPVFLLLLLFPLLAGVRQRIPSFQTAIAVGVAYSVEWYLNPAMNLRFQESVAAHLVASRDFGQGTFGICTRLLGNTIAGAASQILFSTCIIALMLWLNRKVALHDRRWWALIVLAIVLTNPRIMPYDAAVGLIPAAFLIVYGGNRSWLLALPATWACVAAHSTLGFTPVLWAGFAAGVYAFTCPAPPAERLQ